MNSVRLGIEKYLRKFEFDFLMLCCLGGISRFKKNRKFTAMHANFVIKMFTHLEMEISLCFKWDSVPKH